jgi:hypothetical protein
MSFLKWNKRMSNDGALLLGILYPILTYLMIRVKAKCILVKKKNMAI